jgi:hypothetical protein
VADTGPIYWTAPPSLGEPRRPYVYLRRHNARPGQAAEFAPAHAGRGGQAQKVPSAGFSSSAAASSSRSSVIFGGTISDFTSRGGVVLAAGFEAIHPHFTA